MTLEPDVAQLIRKLMRERGLSFKDALNLAVRRGLGAPTTPGRTPTFAMGLPSAPIGHALRLAADLEDEEIARKLTLGEQRPASTAAPGPKASPPRSDAELVDLIRSVPPEEVGHDVTLLQRNLRFTPEGRLRQAAETSDAFSRMRRAMSNDVSQPPPFRPESILRALVDAGVDFVVIGGLAGNAHGSAYPTDDADIAYSRERDNLARLAGALTELRAVLRGAPEGLPFLPDAQTLSAGANFTFDTEFGPLDVVAWTAGVDSYSQLAQDADRMDVAGVTVRVACLADLIRMKEASGRPKDALHASEYRLLEREIQRRAEAAEA